MAFAVSSGRPDYTGNFIPEIWSGKLIENFYDATVLSAISNTDYEGEIRNMGDTVNIRSTPEITIKTYVKGQTLAVENPDKAKLQLVIDKGEYFACVEDDVDQVQSDIALMDQWSKDASERMKIKIDERVLTDLLPDVGASNKGSTAGRISGDINLGVAGTPVAITSSNALIPSSTWVPYLTKLMLLSRIASWLSLLRWLAISSSLTLKTHLSLAMDHLLYGMVALA